jgi:hypothetical protein
MTDTGADTAGEAFLNASRRMRREGWWLRKQCETYDACYKRAGKTAIETTGGLSQQGELNRMTTAVGVYCMS